MVLGNIMAYCVGYNKGIRWSYIINIPKYNLGEDRISHGKILENGSIAIFDGHGGSGAASTLQNIFIDTINKNLLNKCQEGFNMLNIEGIKTGIVDAFQCCEDKFYELNPRDKSGSTVIFATQNNNILLTAWIG